MYNKAQFQRVYILYPYGGLLLLHHKDSVPSLVLRQFIQLYLHPLSDKTICFCLLIVGREKLNSMNLLLYMSPIAVLALLPVALVMEPNVWDVTLALGRDHKFMWLLLLLNSVMAYSANLLNFLVTKHTSALTLQVRQLLDLFLLLNGSRILLPQAHITSFSLHQSYHKFEGYGWIFYKFLSRQKFIQTWTRQSFNNSKPKVHPF